MAFRKTCLKEKISHNKTLLDIVGILAIGLLSITWFRGGLLFNSSDFGLAINRKYYLDISSTIWVNSSTGIANLLSPTSLLFAVFSYFTELVSISLFIYGIKKQEKFKYAVLIALIWLITGFFGPDANVQFTAIYWLAIAIFLLI